MSHACARLLAEIMARAAACALTGFCARMSGAELGDRMKACAGKYNKNLFAAIIMTDCETPGNSLFVSASHFSISSREI
jgi:hypothetical protein